MDTRKKVSDAIERIEKRLAELHRYNGNEQSSITVNGDSSDQPGDEKSTTKKRFWKPLKDGNITAEMRQEIRKILDKEEP